MTSWIRAACVLLFAVGCSHAKNTDATESPAEKQAEERPETKQRKKPLAPEPASQPGDIPVSTSPAGQLAPGADDKIRDKLAAAGFAPEGKSYKEALRRFQGANDLPATGIPDDETVKKLGLPPGEIFRAAVKD